MFFASGVHYSVWLYGQRVKIGQTEDFILAHYVAWTSKEGRWNKIRAGKRSSLRYKALLDGELQQA
jgi:hypothetical protein